MCCTVKVIELMSSESCRGFFVDAYLLKEVAYRAFSAQDCCEVDEKTKQDRAGGSWGDPSLPKLFLESFVLQQLRERVRNVEKTKKCSIR